MPARKYRLLVENPDVLPAEDVNSVRVRVRAQGNVTLSAPGATVDGVAMAAGQEFMADQQSTPTEDGAYVWTGAATPATRSLKMPVGAKVGGMLVSIKEGTDGNKIALITNDETADIIGTNGLTVALSPTSGGSTAASGAAPVANATPALSGTGYTTSGQVVTTTSTHTVTLNQYAGYLFSGPTGLAVILSHPAATGAAVAFTVAGAAPATDAGAYGVFGLGGHSHTL